MFTIKVCQRHTCSLLKYLNGHTCPLRNRVLSKVQAIVGFVSGVTTPKLGNHKRKHTPNDIIEDIRRMTLH